LSLIDKIKTLTPKQKLPYYAFLIGFGIAANLLENIIPKPLPFLRIGIAKISLLIVIYSFDIKYVLLFPILRVSISTLITGTLFTPIFIWSLSGSIGSAFIMFAIAHTYFKKYFSIYGISIIGATTNNIIQWFFITIFFNFYYYTILPFVLLISIASGGIVGYITNYISKSYDKYMK